MPLQLGIGIITYNRQAHVEHTLNQIAIHTRYPFVTVAVADDGSTDGTLDMLQARNTMRVTGTNMGAIWNKNRALFLLMELCRCDIVVLLEDDAFPAAESWEMEWMNAALRWGHANLAGEWMQKHFLSGSGTAEDPILSTAVTAQCSVFSREALLFGGYFDPRFKGYGHGHVEHSRRMVRVGYGGVDEKHEGQWRTVFKLLFGGIKVAETKSFFNREQAERNLTVAKEAFSDYHYRAPWQNEDEMKQFREEMRSATPRVL